MVPSRLEVIEQTYNPRLVSALNKLAIKDILGTTREI